VARRRIPKILIQPTVKPNSLPKNSSKRKRVNPKNARTSNHPLSFPITLKKFYKPHIEKNRVFIIGGGPSVKNLDLSLLKEEDTICVNAAVNYVPNPTYFITMDYSYFNPQRKNNTIDEVINIAKLSYFVVNTSNQYIKTLNGKITDTRRNHVYQGLEKFTGILYSNISDNHHSGFSLNDNEFVNGENSGFCALQLAIKLGYDEIYLLGFDLGLGAKGDTHFHSRYGNTSNIKNKIEEYKKSLLSSIKKYAKSKLSPKSSLFTITDSPLSKIIPKVNLSDVLSIAPKIEDKKPYVIVSYYTINTPYEQEAEKLKRSLDKLKVPYDIVGVENLGSWQANTRFKAKFMSQMLDKHIGKSIVWVDSDAVIHSYPYLFDNYSYDIAVRWQDFRWRKNECLSGTIYMSNTAMMRELCKIWEGENVAEGPNAKTFEQWNLGKAIEDMRNKGLIKDGNLPPEYTMIFDSMREMYTTVDPVIEHFQASRKLKNRV